MHIDPFSLPGLILILASYYSFIFFLSYIFRPKNKKK